MFILDQDVVGQLNDVRHGINHDARCDVNRNGDLIDVVIELDWISNHVHHQE